MHSHQEALLSNGHWVSPFRGNASLATESL